MIAGEVGEHRDIEVDSCCAALVEPVARNFGDQLGGTALPRPRPSTQRDRATRAWCESRARTSPATWYSMVPIRTVLRAAALSSASVKKRRGGFAVGPGDADGGHGALGMPEEGGRGLGQRAAAVLDFDDGMPAR